MSLQYQTQRISERIPIDSTTLRECAEVNLLSSTFFPSISNVVFLWFSGQDIGSYFQQDFLRDIGQLQVKMVQRNDLIETHVLKVKRPFLPRSKVRIRIRLDSNDQSLRTSVDRETFRRITF